MLLDNYALTFVEFWDIVINGVYFNLIKETFTMKLIYGVKDRPKIGQLIVFAFQQLLAIITATLVVPVIIGNGMSPAEAQG